MRHVAPFRLLACVLTIVVLFVFALQLKADPNADADAKAEQIKKLQREADKLREQLKQINDRIVELAGEHRELLVEPAKVSSLPNPLQKKIGEIETEIARLRKAGKTDEADDLADELRSLLVQARDPIAGINAKEPELHVIGLYEGSYPDGKGHGGGKHPQGVAKVEIDYPMQPIVLALCSYEPVKWELNLGEKTNVKQVIISGYYDQAVVGLPKGVVVKNLSGKANPGPRFFAYKSDDARYPYLIRSLRKVTGHKLATFQGTYAFKGDPFVIGAKNESWRHQLAEYRMTSLYGRATVFQRAQARKQMQAVRFNALHLTTTQEGLRYNQSKGSWSEFTPTGPIAQTMKPLPGDNIRHVVNGGKGKTFFGIKSHGVVQFEADKDQVTDLPVDASLPDLSWPSGLAYDSKRNRLVLVSHGGEGFMYSYQLEGKKWSLIGSMNNIDLASLTYSAEDDLLYGLKHVHGRGYGIIYTYSSTGAVIGQTSIKQNIPTTQYGPGANAQLVAVGKYVVVLSNPAPDLELPGEAIVQRSYLINPRTGEVIFSSVLQPHAGQRDLKPEELTTLWSQLTTANSADAEKLMWELAAGTDETVDFLRKQIKPLPEPDEKRVGELIKLLDSDDFKTRENAVKELEKLGGLATAQLKATIETSQSAEVKNSAQRLIAQAEKGVSASPEIRRDVRAMRILGRIATPQAAEYLKELAKDRETAARTREAQAALKRIQQ